MASRFQMMKVQAEVLEDLEKTLNEMIENLTTSYEVIGKENEQARDWRTGELKWEDDEKTIPYFKNVYGRVPVPADQLDEDAKLKADICKGFIKKLDKLI